MRYLAFAIPVLTISTLSGYVSAEVDTMVSNNLNVIEQQPTQTKDTLCRVTTTFPITVQQCGEDCQHLLKGGLIKVEKIGVSPSVEQYVLTDLGRAAYMPASAKLSGGLGNFCFGSITKYEVVSCHVIEDNSQLAVRYKAYISDPHPALYDADFTANYALPNLQQGTTETKPMQKIFRITSQGELSIVR
ncbi:hypothetical protein [Entomomonas asaccharolytica]|uniref:Uncharacterized protein n=1 Tax=Entomomonas asaccharolytica TaxID=2785331 RepID=A0A974NE11_9GAMM|nr:hypothetical protein [Entomomonas asaccharolytica]QQP84818.1 hypothetical protein JHT90_10440 [Entomomonas asaccharolytica]